MTTLTAALFPGQGSQAYVKRSVIARWRPDLLALLEARWKEPFARIDEGTHIAQPVIYCASLAQWEAVRSAEASIGLMAGHSLGGLTALVAAESIDALAGLQLVIARGHVMQAAADTSRGGMLAVATTELDSVSALAGECGVVVAGENSPAQTVVAGPQHALGVFADRARRHGYRTLRLAVSGAFHSPLMTSAAVEFTSVIAAFDFVSPRVPVIAGATAKAFVDPKRELVEELLAPVRWRAVTEALVELGATRCVDVGPGRTLSSLVKATAPGIDMAVYDTHRRTEDAQYERGTQ